MNNVERTIISINTKADIFQNATVSSSHSNTGTEKNPDAGLICFDAFDKTSQTLEDIVSGLRYLAKEDSL